MTRAQLDARLKAELAAWWGERTIAPLTLADLDALRQAFDEVFDQAEIDIGEELEAKENG